MTNSPTNSIPNTTSRVNHFTGLARRRRKFSLLPANGDGSTLTLDFTTGVLDPRLTFTRGTNATFINSNGLVEWAAANFMTQSNNFAVSPWSSTNVTMSIDGSSPVGDAWKMLENNVNNVHRLDPSGVSYGNNGLSMTFSVYVKQGSGSRQAYFAISDNATGDVRSKRLNPVTGSLEGSESVGGSWTNASTSVQSVGGGWYRLVLTVTKNAGTAVICRTGMSDSSGNLSYAGDNTSFLYFAGYQINPGTSAQPYNATTGSAYTAPRFDYDPTTRAPRGLLIEGTATNLAPYSNLQLAWAGGTNTTLTPNTTEVLSPDGTNNAAKIALTNTGYCSRFESITGLANATTYTFSYWIRGTAGNQQRVYSVTQGADLVTQSTLTYTSTGWTRVQITFTSGAANNNVYIYVASRPSGTVNDVLYVYGCQLEAGNGASSLIPTGASTVQRLADNCSIVSPNFAPWYGSPTGWTIVAEMTPQSRAAGSFPGMIALRSAADSGLRIYYYNDGTYNTAFRFGTASTNAEVFGPNGVTYGVPRKFGASVTSGTQFASSAGVQIGSTQTLAVPMDQTLLAIGSDGVSPTPAINCRMHFRSIKYWPYAMTLADLNARTT